MIAAPLIHLQIPLDVVILGLITGLTYALLGMGLVLIYKTSRVLNFAQGQMGLLAASIIPVLVISHGWNYWEAFCLALVFAIVIGAFMELVPIRRLARAPRVIVLVATIGAAQLFFAIDALIPSGNNIGNAEFPVPFKAALTIGSLRLGTADLFILIAVPIITCALAVFLNSTKLGLASKAAAENADAAQLTGIPIRRISLTVWIIAGLLAGVSAILVGPTAPVTNQVAFGPSLMVRGLVAAAIGGMTSMPMAFAGGLGVGILEAVVLWNYPVGGVLDLVLLAVIAACLLIQPRLRQLVRGGEGSSWSLTGSIRQLERTVMRLPRVRLLRASTLAILLLVAVILPIPMLNSQRVLLSSIVLYAMMGLSLTVLTGYAGQISLGQFGFVTIGALVGGRIYQLGYPIGIGLLCAVAAGGLASLIIGLPALRIRGTFLAVITLAFGVACSTWLYGQSWLVHITGGNSSLEIPRPTLFGIQFESEIRFYYLLLVVLVILAALVYGLRMTNLGRSMMAVRDNETAASSLGVSPRRTKLAAFILAGMIAALAGYFYGTFLVNFPDASSFDPSLNLVLISEVILGGVTTVAGALIGAVYLNGLGYLIGPLLPGLLGANVAILLGGVGLLGAIMQFPAGIASFVYRVRDRVVSRFVPRSPDVVGVEPDVSPARQPFASQMGQLVMPMGGKSAAPTIEAEAIVISYGGLRAVDQVSLRADSGEIIGIVGPNGAGKTTLFDALSGNLRPKSGRVLLGGRDITGLRAERRARLGLGRTYQQARLFDDMPLLDAVKLALERGDMSNRTRLRLRLPSFGSERRKDLRAEELLEIIGLGPYSHLHPNEISTGMRRIAEIACTVGMGARVLLLDEPTAGVAKQAAAEFLPILREIRQHLGATMLVIEHDMPLVMGLVDRLYVLNHGAVIAEGPPRLLREDPQVIAAYIGSDEPVVASADTL